MIIEDMIKLKDKNNIAGNRKVRSFKLLCSPQTRCDSILKKKRKRRNEQNTENTRCPTVSSEEFISVDDDNVCTASIMADKDILDFVHCPKNIIDVVIADENEMDNGVHVPTLSKMRNIMKMSLGKGSNEMRSLFPMGLSPRSRYDSSYGNKEFYLVDK
ncbi:hypothetical protein TNCV_2911331 [Trichonephila clavipes]|nr:hypothetical protein TNCV_2911331 [Trichonephila clavipes]